MADDAKLTSVKCLLRSVLQSVKEGVPPRFLNRDYRQFAGENVPFRQFGHDSLENFIRTIPDVVHVSRDKDGEFVYRAVADANTAHIARLVSNQAGRKTRKGGRGGMRRPAFHSRPAIGPRMYGMPPRANTRGSGGRDSNFVFSSSYKKERNTVPSAGREPKPGYSFPQRSSTNTQPSKPMGSRRNIQASPGGSVTVTFVRSPPAKPVNTLRNPSTGFEPVKGCEVDESQIPMVKERVRELVQRRPNGLWNSRLPVEYKETFHEEPPRNLLNLIVKWTDVLNVEELPGTHRTILYPVLPPSPLSSPPQSLTQSRVQLTTPSPARSSPSSSFTTRQTPEPRPGETPVSRVPTLTIPDPVHPLVGTSPSIYISYAVDCSHFFIHLKDSKIIITEIMQLLNDIYEEGNLGNPVKNPTCGSYYAAECDNFWYRAQLLSVDDQGGQKECTIYYVDFGNTDTLSESKMRELKVDLYRWPVQAIRCRLHQVFMKNATHWEEATEKLKSYESFEVTMDVVAHEDDTCVVVLYPPEPGAESFNASLVDSSLALTYMKVSDPGPLELPEEDEWDVVVSGVTSANQVTLRLCGTNYSEKLNDLEELIARSTFDLPFVLEVGDLCAAFDSSTTNEGDIPWYRVRVVRLLDDEVECVYLDYGGSEKLPLDKLRPLLPEEAELPYQAMSAQLSGLEGCEANTKVIEKLTEMWLGKTCIASVDSREGIPMVMLWDTSTDEDIKVNEIIAKVIDVIDLEPVLPEVLSMCEGYVSHIELDGTVYLQIPGPGLLELDALTEEVMNLYGKGGAEGFVKDTSEGRLVMGLYHDGGWYRSVIRENLPGRKVLIHFVDYGNTEVVACSSLRELEKPNKKLHSLPHQAIPVTLDLVQDRMWTTQVAERLGQLAPPDQSVQVETIREPSHGLPAVVHLHQLRQTTQHGTINRQLLEPSLWQPPNEDVVDEPTEDLPEQGAATRDVAEQGAQLRTEAKSQLLPETKDLSPELSMNSTYSDVSSSHGNDDTDEGVAYPVSDLSLSDNVATETGVKTGETTFDRELIKPSMVFAGCLELTPEGAGDPGADLGTKGDLLSKSDEQTEKDLNCNMLCGHTDSASASDVMGDLENAGHDTDGERAMPARAPSPASVSSVHIMWVADPGNFTCVPSEEVENIEELMNQLMLFYDQREEEFLVERVEIGELYAGFWEDRWYRVVVKDIINRPLLGINAMASAHLADFGDFTLVPVNTLRHLPDQFRTYPFQAIQAKLVGIQSKPGGWSAEAIARFENLVLDKTLTAWILGTDNNGRVAMTLLDNEGEATIIHRQLIQEGLADCSSQETNHPE